MKPLLVGEAPGPNGDPEKPLEGRPASFLLALMGIQGPNGGSEPGRELRDLFDVRNLIDRPMERAEGKKGCEWPEKEARKAAAQLRALRTYSDPPSVYLGKRVAKAFGVPLDYWVWTRWDCGRGNLAEVVIPHPSGIVRTWNDPLNRVKAGMTLWQALGKIPL